MPVRPEITGRGRQTTRPEVDREPGPPTEEPEAIEPKQSADAGKEAGQPVPLTRGPPREAYTLAEFCERHRISPAFYYELRKKGLTPDELRLGTRVLVTKESAEAWRVERTRATREVA